MSIKQYQQNVNSSDKKIAELEKKKVINEQEAEESAKMRKRAEALAKKREMEEAAKAMQDKEGVGKFKPRLMTYNDVSKTAEPFDPDKLAKEEDDDDILTDYDMPVDDDMPSEEELAVYDTDYLNADDDEEIIEEENEERK